MTASTPGCSAGVAHLEKSRAGKSLAAWIGQVYDASSVDDRGALVYHLMRPFRHLSMAGVARGVFLSPQFHQGAFSLRFTADDLVHVTGLHVAELAEFVAMASPETIGALGGVMKTNPAFLGLAHAHDFADLLRVVMHGDHPTDYGEPYRAKAPVTGQLARRLER